MKRRTRTAAAWTLVVLPLLSAGWVASHLELLSSYPKKDQTVGTPPIDISLVFSESADSAKTSIALSGPSGAVPVGPLRLQDEGLVVLAKVEGAMPGGTYMVSWTAAAPDQESSKRDDESDTTIHVRDLSEVNAVGLTAEEY